MLRLKYLIRNPATRRFFHGGQWLADSRLADKFADMTEALATCRLFHLQQVDLILEFGSDSGRAHHLQVALPEHLLVGSRAGAKAGALDSNWERTSV